jgi:signal transduction histidine kinase
VSIRFRVILPYLFLTLVVAVAGAYILTRIVADELSERLTNQLLEAGRVVSDDIVRQELNQVETARVAANTRGLADALATDQRSALEEIAAPVAAGHQVESLIIFDAQGQVAANILREPAGTYAISSVRMTGVGIVDAFLDAGDPSDLPRRDFLVNPADGRVYYYSALPLNSEGKLAGVVLVGTSLDMLMPYLRNTSLADVILYGKDGQALASTFGAQSIDSNFLENKSISPELYQQIMASDGNIPGENFFLEGRGYRVALSPIQVGDDRIGAFAVILPLDFVLQPGTINRNNTILLMTTSLIAVVVIGYGISRTIINPLLSLVRTSQAIAGGDLTQRTSIERKDEIGTLANTFDVMTENLQQRTIELERANQILEQMDKTKSSFIQVAGHELRTPLTLISGYAQILDIKARENPELAGIAKGLNEGSLRMQEVVNSMLDISRIEGKTLKVVPEKTSIGFVIAKVQKTFKDAWDERKLSLVTDGISDLPVVQADPDLLYKLFYHLVMNAIKYTPDGGTIRISGSIVEETREKPELEVVVSDTGIGIAPQHLGLIFEKFYQTGEVQLHSSGRTKFKGGGPGLGLAIARGIVEAHHGRIWAESDGYNEDANPGSRFHVRLPLTWEKR